MGRRASLVDQELEMYGSDTFVSIVNDVVRPGFAFDVDDDTTNWPLEVHRHQRTEVSFGVLERVVIARETASWVVLNWTNIFDVSRIFALARHPNGVQGLFRLLFDSLDVFLQIGWHAAWQIAGVVEESRNPAVDFVQLQEYARGALVVIVMVLQRARSVLFDVNIAYGFRWWWLGIITVVNVLTASRNLTGCPVILQEIIQRICPLFVVFLLRTFVPDQRTFHVVFGGQGTEA